MEKDFKKIYINWLNENIEQYKISDTVYRLTLPFLDRNNDCIELFIKLLDDERYYITDDSETINELKLSQFDIFTGTRRREIFDSILAAHGVSFSKNDELYITCSRDSLAQSKHMLSQCIIKVSDMFYLSRKNVKSIFIEDVQNFLDINNIRYIENVSFSGKSKLMSNYDFGIGKSNVAPERIIKVINNFDTTQAKNIIFSWTDTVEERKNKSQLYTFIQDFEKPISKEALSTLKEYSIVPVLWSKRNDYILELSK